MTCRVSQKTKKKKKIKRSHPSRGNKIKIKKEEIKYHEKI